MNTAVQMNAVLQALPQQTQQTRETGGTDGFLSLLGLLLNGMENTGFKAEAVQGEGDEDTGAPEAWDGTGRQGMIAQLLLASTQLPQLIPRESAETASQSGADAKEGMAGAQVVTTPGRNVIARDIRTAGIQTSGADIPAEAAKTEGIRPETVKSADAGTEGAQTRDARADKIQFSVKGPEKTGGEAGAVQAIRLNMGLEAKNGRTDVAAEAPAAESGQAVAVSRIGSAAEAESSETRQTGEGQSFSAKVKRADDGSDAPTKISFDAQAQTPDIRQAGQSVRLEAKAEKLSEAQPDADIRASAASQISSGALDALKNGKSDFKLTLKPDGLGEIEVSMKLEGGGLSMKISAELQSTQKLISSQLPQLRQELSAGERNLSSLGVELKQNGFSSPNGGAYSGQGEGRQTQSRPQYIPYTAQDTGTDGNTYKQISYGSKIYYRI